MVRDPLRLKREEKPQRLSFYTFLSCIHLRPAIRDELPAILYVATRPHGEEGCSSIPQILGDAMQWIPAKEGPS